MRMGATLFSQNTQIFYEKQQITGDGGNKKAASDFARRPFESTVCCGVNLASSIVDPESIIRDQPFL